MNARIHHSDMRQFVSELGSLIDGESDFSDAGVAMYTSDASNYRQIPLGVVYPRHAEDLVAINRLCREHQVPVLMRGAGTSQNGQCVNEAVILDCSRHMNRVLSIDVEAKTAIIEPGVVCDALKAEAEKFGLTFGPDPATHSRCTLGGMIGNNSCGPRSMLAGKTVENVLELDVITSDGTRFQAKPVSENELEDIVVRNDRQGQLYRELKSIRDEYAEDIRQGFPNIKRRVSGYNLDQLLPENGFNVARALVGTEGSCVTVLQAKVRLINLPKYKRLMVLGYPEIYIAGDAVGEIMPFKPIAMEGLDWGIVGGLIDRQLQLDEVSLLPKGKAWLMVELSAESEDELESHCREFVLAMEASERCLSVLPVVDQDKVAKFWSIRELGASATAMSMNPEEPDPAVGWEDVAVDPYQLGDYLREFHALVKRYNYKTTMYGHFGDGCIHARITFDTRSEAGVKHWRKFSEEIAALVVSYGGSLSGEHGDGQAKAEFLPLMFGPRLMEAFSRYKKAWDPELRMNPGKLIHANAMDENLRFGPDYVTPQVETRLQFFEDPSGFGRTTERCVGMGKCRAQHGAMCPSYQVTGEERYSTRGRAHLFHELVRGELVSDGWKDVDIANSLEHCLSCKACKSECPTKVDIAAWKSEFMYRHYAGKRRPMSHYLFGYLGSHLPRLSKVSLLFNAILRSPASSIINRLLGVDPTRKLPPLARVPFSDWSRQHCDDADESFSWFGHADDQPVILWVDSFNSYYRPNVLQAAISVLKKSGCRIGVARNRFCCGRPMYEHGFLEQASDQLQSILQSFQPSLPMDAKVLVLEPSCLSVFKDEMLRLFKDDARAQQLSTRMMSLAEYVEDLNVEPKTTLDRGILHLHCHDKALSSPALERDLMNQCFKRLSEPEAGCCGMAGSFGIKEKTRYIGERLFARNLKASIDDTNSSTVIVTDGFSCTEQFTGYVAKQRSGQEVLHPVEVLDRCL